MEKRVLILNEAHCDGRPELGLSNSFHNILTTYAKASDSNKFHVIHHDEALFTYGRHVDDFLVDYCKRYGINVIVIMLIGESPSNPSVETYKKLREMGVCLTFHWPDSGMSPNYGILVAHHLSKFGLQFIWDNPRSPAHDSLPHNDRIIRLWVPQDLSFFYPIESQDIAASFIGSTNGYNDRNYFISRAKEAIPSLTLGGGQRQEGLGMDAYASLIRRSKVGINFSLSLANFWQTKGRIFEIFASRSMLLEYKNPSTAALFEPGIDYVEFSEADELINKIKYYTNNEVERVAIASSGHKRYMSNYTSALYWKAVMDRVGKEI